MLPAALRPQGCTGRRPVKCVRRLGDGAKVPQLQPPTAQELRSHIFLHVCVCENRKVVFTCDPTMQASVRPFSCAPTRL